MTDLSAIIDSSAEVLGGAAVFRGTRVPLKNLIDCLEAGETIDQFLDEFPSVSRVQAVAALEAARERLTADARSSG